MNNIGQYRSDITGGIGNYTNDSPEKYVKLIADGTESIIVAEGATASSNGNESITFNDSCVFLKENKMDADHNYYFHGKIKLKLDSAQTFSVILIDSTGTYENQFIQKIECTRGQEGTFEDVEFIFHPFAVYDTICFELQRESVDYRNPRETCIIYLELSEIQNMLKTTSIYSNIGEDNNLIKIGVQGRPNTIMCINGNGIRTGLSGIYELRDNTISISFFSVLQGAKEINPIDYTEIKTSKCFFNSEKQREIVLFSLDYTYKVK